MSKLFTIEECRGHCTAACKRGYHFRHHDPKWDVLGSTFDDFGYDVYIDNGVEHRRYFHQHLGVIESYTHYFDNEPPPGQLSKTVIDNSYETKQKIVGYFDQFFEEI